ncbi:TPA: hypothetical protein PM991_003072 [Listeria monocytogenes]|nr:hypothetical protein [Listeria monocytogenes]HDI3440518.1 hypothetical protein [Listeria monocytogenes]
MNHILVLPEEFETKLNEAHANNDIHTKWLHIGVDTVQDMINRIISKMNERFPKLNITNYRTESKDNIKETIGNRGSNSIYTGYFETEEGNVDGLFFYIPPSLNSGNDFLTRQVMPSLLGIYEGISHDMIDLHFNNRPIFIANINETNRSEQRAVKVSFICAELLGFQYVDIFERDFHDVVESLNEEGDDEFQISSLADFNRLFETNGDNELFEVKSDEKVLQLLSAKVTTSKNPSAEMYRYLLKILPAIYLAIEEEYQVNVDDFNNAHLNMFDVIRTYISKI